MHRKTRPSDLNNFVTLEVNGTKTRFKIDSGSQANIIPKKDYQLLKNKPGLKPIRTRLTVYKTTSIPVQGKYAVQIPHKNNTYNVPIIVADTDASSILGQKNSVAMHLIKRVLSISKGEPVFLSNLKDCFGELGTLPEYHHITIDPNIKTMINPPRKVPFALKPRLKLELQRMTQLDTIIPVNEPTDWVSSLLVVEKLNGNLQVCLDPRNLNKAIKREHHRLPTATDIFQEMAGAQYFTKLDASNAFWQIRVDEESSKLNSPCDRFKFLHIPCRIHSASKVCQTRIAAIIESIEECRNAQDDTIIWADTPELLENRTIEVLQAVRRSGLKLNRAKCQFSQRQLTFFGHMISDKGIAPDARKINAITEMPEPTNQPTNQLKRTTKLLRHDYIPGKISPKLLNENSTLTSSGEGHYLVL